MEDAVAQYNTGLELKAKGQKDAALTCFRRAVIIDPKHFPSLMEMGALCREKAKLDRVFLRHTFEAFRQAARLDLTHEEAHNQYIMAGQQMGVLDSLLVEYNDWIKQNPENELMKKMHKNIVTISMAMMPDSVNIGPARSMRKPILIASILVLAIGLVLLIGAPIYLKTKKLKKEPSATESPIVVSGSPAPIPQ